ncbi:MAG TPA: copper resistance protein B [Allosphingosinicella sp.]|jgi:copper resistance protein B
MRLVLAAAVLALPAAPAAAQKLGYASAAELDGGKEEAVEPRLQYVLLDRLEWAPKGGAGGYAWDFSAQYGATNGIWLSSVGEGSLWGSPDYLEFQALYARDIGRGFQANVGPRWDARPTPQRVYLTAGGQWSDEWGDNDAWIGAFTYVSHKGELSARLGGIYNHKLTDALFIQPSFELNASSEDVPALGLGRGLSYAEAGLRLRYEIGRFAPYLGLSWESSFGRTARWARQEGEEIVTKGVVIGLRYSWEPPETPSSGE